jgi:ABC-type transport system involved in multi-copper enzyme maturation permease subunit
MDVGVPQGPASEGSAAWRLVQPVFRNRADNGGMRNLLVRQPRRVRLLAGKLLAVAGLVTIAVLVSVAAGRGLDTGAWTTATGLQALASGAGDLVLATLGWGLLGAALGIVLRSPAPAVGVGVAYALPLEAILTAAWSQGARWLPGQLLGALATGGTADVTYARAAVLLAVYLAIALAAAATLFARRDVTA